MVDCNLRPWVRQLFLGYNWNNMKCENTILNTILIVGYVCTVPKQTQLVYVAFPTQQTSFKQYILSRISSFLRVTTGVNCNGFTRVKSVYGRFAVVFCFFRSGKLLQNSSISIYPH